MTARPFSRIDRRTALLGLATLSCGRCAPEAPLAGGNWRDLAFEPGPDAPEGQRALTFVPPGIAAAPLLVALHGRGESGRGLAVGANAWREDYGLERLHERCLSPPLRGDDVGGMITTERLNDLNRSLADAPYRGVCVTCPYTPDLADRSPRGANGFGRFLVERLLPRVRETASAATDRKATGIDGVSMGGRLALIVGLEHPETFGNVGALQPAIRAEEASLFTELARTAVARAPIALRLVSSDGDPFLPAVRALSDSLRAAQIAHELLVVPGPHDYAWNRGPGGLEMLVWHERLGRGLRSPS